uniref:Uncharacterized protein n=1 Tax=Trichuris muris TaxID=70415 RepID=A0A5S6QND8_TRIMR
MNYCRLCSYKSGNKRCVAVHVQYAHHVGVKKSLQYVSELNPAVCQPAEKNECSSVAPPNALSMEIKALEIILNEAESIAKARQNPTSCAGRYSRPRCVGCLAYRCEMESMEKILKEMELIEKLKTIDHDGNTPLPNTGASPEQRTTVEQLRNSGLRMLISLGYISACNEV